MISHSPLLHTYNLALELEPLLLLVFFTSTSVSSSSTFSLSLSTASANNLQPNFSTSVNTLLPTLAESLRFLPSLLEMAMLST